MQRLEQAKEEGRDDDVSAYLCPVISEYLSPKLGNVSDEGKNLRPQARKN